MARPTDGLSGVRWASGDGPVRTPAPTGLGHRTWFVKTGVGAHSVRPSFIGAAGVGRAGAQCAPLHVVYRHYRKARRHLPQRASARTIKFRGQVGRRRQSGSGCLQHGYRRGDALGIPSALREPPPPRPKRQAKTTHQSTEVAPRLGVLRGERMRAVSRRRRG